MYKQPKIYVRRDKLKTKKGKLVLIAPKPAPSGVKTSATGKWILSTMKRKGT